MTAHPEIGQVNQSDLGAFRELSGLVRVDLSVTNLPELHRLSKGVATFAVFCLICPFLMPVPLCPSWESRDLCTCRALWDPLVKTSADTNLLKQEFTFLS